MDVIMLALPRWDGPYSSTAISLAKELAKANRVFYVDNPFTMKDVLTGFQSRQVKRRMKSFLRGRSYIHEDVSDTDRRIVYVTPPAMLPVNFLSTGFLYDSILALNDRIFFAAMKKLMDTYNIRDFIFINVYNPFYGHQFPSFFKPRTFIYYSVDNIGQSRYVSKHGPRLEGEILRRVDLALTTSKELWNQARSKTSNAHYLPNAADIGLFLKKPSINIEKPEEFKVIQTPIIIYTGHIDVRLDYDLIKGILTHHPDKTLVMVGPHSIDKGLYDELRSFPNMRFLGGRALAELPAFLYHSNCAIIPFKCNELTRSIYPLKVNEYLAAGLPVVSTAFSEDIRGFSDVVEIADSMDDFCQKITAAIRDDHDAVRDARVKVASGNNWANRAERFWDIVGRFTHLNSIAPMS